MSMCNYKFEKMGRFIYQNVSNKIIRTFHNEDGINDLSKQSYLRKNVVLTFIFKTVCPLAKKYRSPLVDDFLYQLENLIVAN